MGLGVNMDILKKIAKLIDVKSIITIALVVVLCVITLTKGEMNDIFNSAVMLVLGFFFGKKNTPETPTEGAEM